MTTRVAEQVMAAVGRWAGPILEATLAPGFVVAVSDREGVLTRAYGVEGTTGDPLSPDRPFWLGSVGKVFISLAAHRLIDAGEMSPADAVRPGFTLPSPWGRVPTVGELLTHRGGYGVDITWARPAGEMGTPLYGIFDTGRMREYDRSRLLCVNPPGEVTEYSTAGQEAVCAHIAHLTRTSYRRHAAEVAPGIYEPGMGADRPGPGVMIFGRDLYARSPDLDTDTPGSAGMAGTMAATARALRGLLTMAEGGSGVISDESVKEIRTPVAPYVLYGRPSPFAVGQGVQVAAHGTPLVRVGHEGCYPLTSWTTAWAYPEHGVTIAVGVPAWRMPGWYWSPESSPMGLVRELAELVMMGQPIGEPLSPAYAAGIVAAHHLRLIGVPNLPEVQALGGGEEREAFRAGVLSLGTVTSATAISEKLAPSRFALKLAGLVWGGKVDIPHSTYGQPTEPAD